MGEGNVCPKCNYQYISGLMECPKCGIVFSKYSNKKQMKPEADRKEAISKNIDGWICSCGISNKASHLTCQGCGWTKEKSEEYIKTKSIDSKQQQESQTNISPNIGENINKKYFSINRIRFIIPIAIGLLLIISGILTPLTAPDSNVINIGRLHEREMLIHGGMFLVLCGLIIWGIRDLLIEISNRKEL